MSNLCLSTLDLTLRGAKHLQLSLPVHPGPHSRFMGAAAGKPSWDLAFRARRTNLSLGETWVWACGEFHLLSHFNLISMPSLEILWALSGGSHEGSPVLPCLRPPNSCKESATDCSQISLLLLLLSLVSSSPAPHTQGVEGQIDTPTHAPWRA